jgi:phosphoribosylformimino-5-aminoimidazole carboxamide ribotide isomerase
LDLKDGRPLGRARNQPAEVVGFAAVEAGIKRMIVLDLASVGAGRGVPTVSLCHALKNRWPEIVVWTGGGVRSVADLHTLALHLVDGVLVASALHDGLIQPSDCRAFQRFSSGEMLQAMDA